MSCYSNGCSGCNSIQCTCGYNPCRNTCPNTCSSYSNTCSYCYNTCPPYPSTCCGCQGFVGNSGTITATFNSTTMSTGTGTIFANYSPTCTAPTFNYTFTDNATTNTFNFVATSTISVSCNYTSLTLVGLGNLTIAGSTTGSVPFRLTLLCSGGVCSYSLSINEGNVIQTVPLISIGPVNVVCGCELSISGCATRVY